MGCWPSTVACALLVVSGRGLAHADAPAAPKADSPALSGYLRAMGDARLAPSQTASVAELRKLLALAERLYLEGRYDEASILLLEAVESPRFAAFRDFDEYAAAEHRTGAALLRLGSLKTARIYLERVIARGSKSPYYGPAVRSYVDVALRLGDTEKAAEWLAQYEPSMPEDARGELDYLRGRAHYDRGETTEAARAFDRIAKRSRFYANAQYLIGAIAAHARQYKPAEKRFCAIASQGVDDHYSFYVDQRFFTVQDLARLALGRTAHEQGRGDDAFYYYFQVPTDSPRLAEALFEAAYASYEAKDHDAALDLLDQLQARFPDSAFVDEAGILRGYVALARCEFEQADREFAAFARHFEPLIGELDRLLQNASRRADLYDELVAGKPGARASTTVRKTLLALLRVDPQFFSLQASIDDLDAESARASRVSDALSVLYVRLQGGDRPRAASAEATSDPERDAIARDLSLAAASVRALGEQLDALRAAGAPGAQLQAAEQELSGLAERVQKLHGRERLLRASTTAAEQTPALQGPGLAALLARDAVVARSLPRQSAAVRARLVEAASLRAERALRDLRARLDGLLRRARIGRIDAVMGSKRRIETQIASLAAGRFPAELRDPLAVQGLLADDEEYWPFEGENWPDEYEERYGTPSEPAAPAERGKR